MINAACGGGSRVPKKIHSSPTPYQVGGPPSATPGLRHRHGGHPALKSHSTLEEAGLGPEVAQVHQLTSMAEAALWNPGQLCPGLGWWVASPQTRQRGDCEGPL